MKRSEQHVDRVTINGHDMFVGYSPVQGFGGSLAVVASVDELTAEAARITSGIQDEGQRTLQITLIAMGVLFLIGLAGASYLNRRVLVRPIEALVRGTRAVAGGDLDARIPARGDDELAILARSFNEMTSQLRARTVALEAEVKEREAAQEELSALFAAMTDWVLVLNREGTFVRVPRTSAVTLVTERENLVGMHLSQILPPAEAEAMVGNIQRALAERKTFVEEYPVETPEGTHWFSSALSPISNDEVVVVARDITDRVNARQVLEKQVEERTQELRSLLDVSTDIASTLELAPLLDRIVDRIQDIAEYVRCTIFVVEGNRLVTLNSRSDNAQPIGAFTLNRDDVMPLWERLAKNQHLIIEDVLDDSDLARLYRASVGDLLVTALQDVRCWMSVPLFWQDRVIGMLTLSHSEPGHYTDRHASLVSGIATQVAVAIENARLYADTQRAARENEALLRADAELFRTLSLDSVLQSLADVTVDILQVDKSILTVAEGGRQRIGASRNISDEGLARIGGRLSSLSFDVSDAPATFIMDDNETDSRPEPREIWAAEGIRSYVVVPIISGERTIGSFLAGYSQLHAFNPSEMRAFQALAERGAVAIQNAELYARSQQAASLEERQRLARELHDSVSQALYGIALGARTARTLLDRDPAKSVEPVDYVLSLAEAGLAEMRALIFELRPESLESEGLVAALDKQVAATSARHRIDVDADLGEEPPLSLQEKEIFYRIGQEALHNVVKHSRASRASVRLANEGESVVLEVADNGGGFDPGESFPGHLGLVSMRERAGSIGATLHIASAPGQGTLVRLRMSRNGNGNGQKGNGALS
jgi:PAS domain S-box-containing protein